MKLRWMPVIASALFAASCDSSSSSGSNLTAAGGTTACRTYPTAGSVAVRGSVNITA